MIAVLVGLTSVGPVLGTAQEPDIVTIKGTTWYLATYVDYSSPLEILFARNLVPRFCGNNDIINSANWRGHTATWEIHGGKLTLRSVVDLRGHTCAVPRVGVQNIAALFSGWLLIQDAPYSANIQKLLRINAGRVTTECTYSGAMFVDQLDCAGVSYSSYLETIRRPH